MSILIYAVLVLAFIAALYACVKAHAKCEALKAKQLDELFAIRSICHTTVMYLETTPNEPTSVSKQMAISQINTIIEMVEDAKLRF